ncbi:transposon Ty3-G Gag-Pol polyprotein [Trichonephila clavipes]|nr:transposon Ty3-G Gag-Pol polyprotein [Trichonephila clavipes]
MCDSTIPILGCPKAITDSKTKFNYIIAHLPPEAATIIRDVIMNPDPVEPYEKARTELIKRSGESSHQEIREITHREELGDRRPSELLRVMRRRAESHSVPDDSCLNFSSSICPFRVQSILAAISPLTLEKAAEVADRVMEVTPIAASRRIFQWIFLVGNVSTPIIGADFLYNFRLVPDITKARRLAPDRLRIAKAEFEHDYSRSYDLPKILLLIFTVQKIYSHIDLVKALSSNSINPDDVHKSAIITPLGLFESTPDAAWSLQCRCTFQRFIDEVSAKSSICVRFCR